MPAEFTVYYVEGEGGRIYPTFNPGDVFDLEPGQYQTIRVCISDDDHRVAPSPYSYSIPVSLSDLLLGGMRESGVPEGFTLREPTGRKDIRVSDVPELQEFSEVLASRGIRRLGYIELPTFRRSEYPRIAHGWRLFADGGEGHVVTPEMLKRACLIFDRVNPRSAEDTYLYPPSSGFRTRLGEAGFFVGASPYLIRDDSQAADKRLKGVRARQRTERNNAIRAARTTFRDKVAILDGTNPRFAVHAIDAIYDRYLKAYSDTIDPHADVTVSQPHSRWSHEAGTSGPELRAIRYRISMMHSLIAAFEEVRHVNLERYQRIQRRIVHQARQAVNNFPSNNPLVVAWCWLQAHRKSFLHVTDGRRKWWAHELYSFISRLCPDIEDIVAAYRRNVETDRDDAFKILSVTADELAKFDAEEARSSARDANAKSKSGDNRKDAAASSSQSDSDYDFNQDT